METVNNRKLRDQYIHAQGIMNCFSICKPNFLLLHYSPHELLTTPFSPSQYREVLQKDPVFLLYLCRALASKLNGAVADSRHMPLRLRVELSLKYVSENDEITNIGHLAKTLNVSNRQLLRVLKELCSEGILEHTDKGRYRVLRPEI